MYRLSALLAAAIALGLVAPGNGKRQSGSLDVLAGENKIESDSHDALLDEAKEEGSAPFESKFKKADPNEATGLFGYGRGTQFPLLIQGEDIQLCYKKGAKDWLLFTPKRLVHIDKIGFNGVKTHYISYVWHHIVKYEVESVGSWEVSLSGADSELDVFMDFKPPAELKVSLHFDFQKSTDIHEMSKYIYQMTRSLAQRPLRRRAAAMAPLLIGYEPVRFDASKTGRLYQIEEGKARQVFGKMLMEEETIVAAFSFSNDHAVFTNTRLIVADKKRMDSKTTYTSHFYPEFIENGVAAWGVRTAGRRDFDTEMWIAVPGVGIMYAEFIKGTDTLKLYATLTNLLMQNMARDPRANDGGGSRATSSFSAPPPPATGYGAAASGFGASPGGYTGYGQPSAPVGHAAPGGYTGYGQPSAPGGYTGYGQQPFGNGPTQYY